MLRPLPSCAANHRTKTIIPNPLRRRALVVTSKLMLTYAPLSTPSPLEIQYALERRERKTYRLPRLPGSGGGTSGFP